MKYRDKDGFRRLLDTVLRCTDGRPATEGGLARALGISLSSFYKYASGDRKPPESLIDTMLAIVDGQMKLRQVDSERVNQFGPVRAEYVLEPTRKDS